MFSVSLFNLVSHNLSRDILVDSYQPSFTRFLSWVNITINQFQQGLLLRIIFMLTQLGFTLRFTQFKLQQHFKVQIFVHFNDSCIHFMHPFLSFVHETQRSWVNQAFLGLDEFMVCIIWAEIIKLKFLVSLKCINSNLDS